MEKDTVYKTFHPSKVTIIPFKYQAVDKNTDYKIGDECYIIDDANRLIKVRVIGFKNGGKMVMGEIIEGSE